VVETGALSETIGNSGPEKKCFFERRDMGEDFEKHMKSLNDVNEIRKTRISEIKGQSIDRRK
jgi:hypothetical protein